MTRLFLARLVYRLLSNNSSSVHWFSLSFSKPWNSDGIHFYNTLSQWRNKYVCIYEYIVVMIRSLQEFNQFNFNRVNGHIHESTVIKDNKTNSGQHVKIMLSWLLPVNLFNPWNICRLCSRKLQKPESIRKYYCWINEWERVATFWILQK